MVTVGGLLMGIAQMAQAADAPSAANQALIRQVIQAQLDAFRQDDAAAAFSFASPTIQAMFGTAERFMAMVRGGYQPVYRPREVAFQPLRVIEDQVIQPVTVVGPDGEPVIALYKMEWLDAEKVWKINGCVLAQSPDKGA